MRNRTTMPPCIDCGKPVSSKKTKRCRACYFRYQSRPDRPRSPVICRECGKPLPNRNRSGLCSPCQTAHVSKTHQCVNCGGPISTPKTKICRKCFQRLAKPIAHCVDCGKKIANKDGVRCAKCHAKIRKGANNPNWRGGRTICPKCGGVKSETTKGVCMSCKRKYDYIGPPKCVNCGKPVSRHRPSSATPYCKSCYRGERTARWNHGLTAEQRANQRSMTPEYAEWRKTVFKRDSYTCQKCGYAKGGKIVVHHICSYKTAPELRTVVSNGITLCRRCHIRFHRIFGQTGNTREQIDMFLMGSLWSVQDDITQVA